MEDGVKKLLIQALGGEAAAWRQLALPLSEGGSGTDRDLCRIFLHKAIELGDEDSFFLYHQLFSGGSIPVDRASYIGMLADYMNTDDLQVREQLGRYLNQFA